MGWDSFARNLGAASFGNPCNARMTALGIFFHIIADTGFCTNHHRIAQPSRHQRFSGAHGNFIKLALNLLFFCRLRNQIMIANRSTANRDNDIRPSAKENACSSD